MTHPVLSQRQERVTNRKHGTIKAVPAAEGEVSHIGSPETTRGPWYPGHHICTSLLSGAQIVPSCSLYSCCPGNCSLCPSLLLTAFHLPETREGLPAGGRVLLAVGFPLPLAALIFSSSLKRVG